MTPRLLAGLLLFSLLTGCQAPLPEVMAQPAARMSVGGAEETSQYASLVVQSGTIVDDTEPEGFGTDSVALTD